MKQKLRLTPLEVMVALVLLGVIALITTPSYMKLVDRWGAANPANTDPSAIEPGSAKNLSGVPVAENGNREGFHSTLAKR